MAKSYNTAKLQPVGMVIESWPISKPIPYARNARKISSAAVDKVAASIKEFGFRQPLVVDSEAVLVLGHVRLLAAKKLGLETVPVHVASDLTPAQIDAYRLMDNRSHDEAVWDYELLIPTMSELSAQGVELKLTGFNPGEIKGIIIDAAKAHVDSLYPDSDESPQSTHEGATSQSPESQTPQMDTREYRIVITCENELQHTELFDRFSAEGLNCKVQIG